MAVRIVTLGGLALVFESLIIVFISSPLAVGLSAALVGSTSYARARRPQRPPFGGRATLCCKILLTGVCLVKLTQKERLSAKPNTLL